jgi:hypothetical protein
VRVEVFSKMRAISLPWSRFASVPAYFAILSALAHADHHRAVSDRLHVAAFDMAAAPVLIRPAQPDRELPAANIGWNR